MCCIDDNLDALPEDLANDEAGRLLAELTEVEEKALEALLAETHGAVERLLAELAASDACPCCGRSPEPQKTSENLGKPDKT